MGVAYNELGKYQKAINAYKEAIKIKPDYHEACQWLFDPLLIYYKLPPYCNKPYENQA
jgi:tetratricopeptide (TPR) repeat protein